MKVSGFTFVRNGTLLGYPFIESIRSVLPICDEFVVAVARGDDDTPERLRYAEMARVVRPAISQPARKHLCNLTRKISLTKTWRHGAGLSRRVNRQPIK